MCYWESIALHGSSFLWRIFWMLFEWRKSHSERDLSFTNGKCRDKSSRDWSTLLEIRRAQMCGRLHIKAAHHLPNSGAYSFFTCERVFLWKRRDLLCCNSCGKFPRVFDQWCASEADTNKAWMVNEEQMQLVYDSGWKMCDVEWTWTGQRNVVKPVELFT